MSLATSNNGLSGIPSMPASWALIGLALTVHLLVVNFYPAFPSPNEWPRVYQALALVHRGALDIGPEQERFGGTEDTAVFRGRLYPNKAPGLLPLLIPAAGLAHFLTPCGSVEELRLAYLLGRLSCSTAPFFLTWLLLATWPGVPRARARWVAVSWALASPALAAGLTLFAHTLSAFLLLAAVRLLETRRETLAFPVGVFLGVAVVSEYQLGVPAALIVIAFARDLSWRGLLRVATGGSVALLLLGLYNQHCFGSWWSLSTAHETNPAFAALRQQGLHGVGLPTSKGLWGLLASPTRGLLVWCPMAVAGLWPRRTRTRRSSTQRAAILAGAGLLVLMAGFCDWHGGWFSGPRYLVPVLPLLFLHVAFWDRPGRFPSVENVLLVVSAAWGVLTSWGTLVAFPFPPDDFVFPVFTFSLPLAVEGICLASWLPCPGWWLLVATGFVVTASALVLPIWRTGQRKATLLGLLLAGIAVVMVSRLANPPQSWKGRLELAVVREVYCGIRPPLALTGLTRECQTQVQCEQVARWLAEVRRSESLSR